jgi:hypothetical protein
VPSEGENLFLLTTTLLLFGWRMFSVTDSLLLKYMSDQIRVSLLKVDSEGHNSSPIWKDLKKATVQAA